jgi:hypothetical protein
MNELLKTWESYRLDAFVCFNSCQFSGTRHSSEFLLWGIHNAEQRASYSDCFPGIEYNRRIGNRVFSVLPEATEDHDPA